MQNPLVIVLDAYSELCHIYGYRQSLCDSGNSEPCNHSQNIWDKLKFHVKQPNAGKI